MDAVEIGPSTVGMIEVGGLSMIRLILPKPPSANRFWRVYRNVVVKSKEALAYVALVRTYAKNLRVRPILAGDVGVELRWYRGAKLGDLDNLAKCAMDSLKGVAFRDDAQIAELRMYRTDGMKPERVEVTVWKL